MPLSERSKIRARRLAKSQQSVSEEKVEDDDNSILKPSKKQKLYHDNASVSDNSDNEEEISIEDLTNVKDSSEESSISSISKTDEVSEDNDDDAEEDSESSGWRSRTTNHNSMQKTQQLWKL